MVTNKTTNKTTQAPALRGTAPRTAKKTWAQKLQNDHGLPKVEPIPANAEARWGRGTMLIAAPRAVDALMRQVKKGELATIDDLRRALAARHGATVTCPLTTGIFANIAAHAADESEQAGGKRVTPYWRTLKAQGELNPKFPGGLGNLRARLEAEGHVVVARGRRLFVVDFDRSRARLAAE